MKFVVGNLGPCSKTVTVFSVDDLFATLSSLYPSLSKYILCKVDFFACHSFDRFFSSKKYNFFVRKVIK